MTANGYNVSVLADVRLAEGRTVDIVMRDGRIADIAPGPAAAASSATRIDGAGLLALPGLVDGHVHLDKTLTGLPWMPHGAGPDRMSRIENDKTLRGTLPPIAERAANLVRRCIAFGTTAIRTHVDIDPDLGLSQLHALVEVRERFAGRVDMQIVAFPQSGVMRMPGTADLLDAALDEGADLLGGIDPILIDSDLDGQLDALFAIAERRDVGIDIHLHDPSADGLTEIAALSKRTKAAGLGGRVTASHGFSLGAANEDDFARTADAMAAAGVSLVTHGGGAMPLPPVKALRDRGVTVFAGNDDVRDTWSPFGNGDMLERAMLLAWRSGYRTDDDLAVAFDCASAAGAGILGLDGHGLEPGARADLFTVAADTLGEAVAQRPPRGIVVKSGRLVARDGKLVDDA
ncbi:MAG: amidohydrolase family protein [Alphaproteobacteria bacterium]|nr:amidohydrolase family protein [Alphaproteobacteria bacterium]